MKYDEWSNKGVSITVWSKDQDFSVMGFIVDHLDMLITEWYPGIKISNVLDFAKRKVFIASAMYLSLKGPNFGVIGKSTASRPKFWKDRLGKIWIASEVTHLFY